MIKTQLCPNSELENKNWWHLDAAVLIFIGALGMFLMQSYFDGIKVEITQLQEKKAHWEKEFATRQTGLEKFKNLSAEIELLNKKIGALKRITTSKIDKVRPLLALDQLQTLWMEGVWYEELDYQASGLTKVVGSAHDSILIGEYMLGMRETMNLDTRNDDLRTQLGFDGLTLKGANLITSGDELFADIKKKMRFELSAKHVEKTAPPVPAASVTLGPRPRAPFGSSF